MPDVNIIIDVLSTQGGTMQGNLAMGSGAEITFGNSGTNTIGSPGNPASVIYTNSIFVSGNSGGGPVTGVFLPLGGGTLTGNLYLINSTLEIASNLTDNAIATGQNILVIGDSNSASGTNIFVGGLLNVSSGTSNGIIFGANNSDLGGSSNALFGQQNTISNADFSLIAGNDNTISGSDFTLVVGFQNSCGPNPFNIVGGAFNTVSSVFSITVGGNNTNNGYFSDVFGQRNIINDVNSNSSFVAGIGNSLTNSVTVAVFGQDHVVSGSSLGLVGGIGNSITNSESNLVVGNSNTVNNTGNGQGSNLIFGNGNFSSNSQFSIMGGQNNLTEGFGTLTLGQYAVTSGDYATAIGFGVTAASTGTVVMGDAAPNGVFYTGTTPNAMYLRFANGVTLTSGTNLVVDSSGNSNVGTAASPMGTVYANSFVGNLQGLSGNYLPLNGGDLTGSIEFTNGAGITSNGTLVVNVPTFVVQSTGSNIIEAGANGITIADNVNNNTITSSSSGLFLSSNKVLNISSTQAMTLTSPVSGISTQGNIFPVTSGTDNIGKSYLPYHYLYANGIVMQSANGTQWLISITNSGTLTAVSGTY